MDAVSVKRAQLFLLRKKSLCLRLPGELERPKTKAENKRRKIVSQKEKALEKTQVFLGDSLKTPAFIFCFLKPRG